MITVDDIGIKSTGTGPKFVLCYMAGDSVALIAGYEELNVSCKAQELEVFETEQKMTSRMAAVGVTAPPPVLEELEDI